MSISMHSNPVSTPSPTPVRFGKKNLLKIYLQSPDDASFQQKSEKDLSRDAHKAKKILNRTKLGIVAAAGVFLTSVGSLVMGISDTRVENPGQVAEQVEAVGLEEALKSHDSQNEDLIQKLDEAYSLVIAEAEEYVGAEVSSREVADFQQIMETKRPEVLALASELNAADRLNDPKALFDGLTAIFKDELTPQQYDDLQSLKPYFEQTEGNIINPNGLGIAAISLYLTIILTIRKNGYSEVLQNITDRRENSKAGNQPPSPEAQD